MKNLQLNLFKKLAASCGLLLLLQGAHAQTVPFSFPVYEPFQYPNNEVLGTTGSSGTNWWAGNSATSSGWHPNAVAALAYPGLLPDTNTTPRGLVANTGTGKSRFTGFPANVGTIYASFLLNITNLNTGADRLFFLLSSSTNSAATPSGVWIDSANRLKISKNSSATPATNVTSALVLSNTYLVVLRYRTTGSNDEVALWLDPPFFGDNANIPAPTIITTNNANASTFQGMGVYGAANTPMFFMDEIRVDNNWAGVTPKSTSPGQIYPVTGGGSGCPGDSFAVGLSGSVAGNDYLLYTNSIYTGTTVSGTGSAITFGAQSTTATYSVLASNTTTAAVGWMTNTVTVSVLTAPSIITQPAPVLTATNNVGVFTVVASGIGLNYRWYRNGGALTDGGHVAGAGTSTLVISPATTADVATTSQGYYCIITNACGLAAISSTNSLTLDAPVNIVWQGGNPNTNWDLATTANFTNSAGSAVKFNGGDNVILNDSSTNPVISVVGSYITPTLVKDDASQNYFITAGSSAITGGGALLMSGSGTLTFSNVNTFTGGTTISNGTVKLQNYSALGSGTVTMAGGTLNIPLKGTASTGVSNNINVTADSTIQYAQNGSSFSAVIFGALTGVPGTTLTINETDANTASVARLRLYGSFTNDAAITLTTVGAVNEIAPYQAAGNQVYNGVISGNGHFILRNGGKVIFNNANTMSDGTYSVIVSGGTLGLGVDSTYSTPPTLASSPIGFNDLVLDLAAGNCTLTAENGARTLGNGIHYLAVSASDTGAFVLSGSNSLTLEGAIQLTQASDAYGTNRTFNVNNTAATTISGVISDNGLGSGITKVSSGALYLNAANTYTGPTTNSAGLLAGTGSLASPVFVQTGASIGGGSATAIGTLTINNNLTLSGNGFFRLNKSLSPQSNDMVSVTGVLTNTGTGTITVITNGGPALVVGDSFKLFSGAVSNGTAITITGGGMNWTNKLAIDGSIQALSVASTTASYPTNISYSVSGSTLTITWPATHQGWILQNQTNALNVGLTTPTNTWYDVPNSTSTTQAVITVNPANPTVFYRLKHP